VKGDRIPAARRPRRRVGLKIGPHCIETAARIEIRRVEYLMLGLDPADPGLPPLEDRRGILERFLGSTDFAGLRASRPELDGRTKMKVTVREQDDGRLVLEVEIPEAPPGET
jgi:hypothetical protein